jgi:DNA polymerase-1
MTPLIDSDLLLHEVGWSSQFRDKTIGKDVLLDFDQVAHLLDEKIRIICYETDATEDPILFLSDSETLTAKLNRESRLFGRDTRVYTPNFRIARATSAPYKGTRSQPKPFHFWNIQTYIRSKYKHIISSDGLEADDELGIYQYERLNRGEGTIICSRDKDLRMVPGNHYSWECGKQRSIGPEHTDGLGRLDPPDKGKLLGYGRLFFCYQMLTGDTVDNIPGIKGCGPVYAYNLLKGCTSEEDALLRVRGVYQEKLPHDKWEDYFYEQGDLLWIQINRGEKFSDKF